MPNTRERGQVIILVLLAMSLFLIGAIGLGIDGSHLYAQRQMAQAAADAAAQAAIMSVFDKTNTSGGASFPTTAFTCGTADPKTPCVYARINGFGGSASDTVYVDFPDASAAPGVSLSPTDPVNLARVTVTRSVNTTLMRLLGPTATSVTAKGIAAIVSVTSPAPIIVLHPTAPCALETIGTPDIDICGGPPRSIQVNSSNASAFCSKGSARIDLSRAGPKDPGDCTSGTGADFGVWGGPPDQPAGSISFGAGQYIQPSSPILDPLALVPAPGNPGPPAYDPCEVGSGDPGCPAATLFGCPVASCTLYYPGSYPTGPKGEFDLNFKNTTALFMPGIYYVTDNSNFEFESQGNGRMATGVGPGLEPHAVTGNGMVVYMSGSGIFRVWANAGKESGITLLGAPVGSIYMGILFFSRNPGSSDLGGGGAMSLTGTIYLPEQHLNLGGGSGSSTLIKGQIIVSMLDLGGNSGIKMQLDPEGMYTIRQVALVQ